MGQQQAMYVRLRQQEDLVYQPPYPVEICDATHVAFPSQFAVEVADAQKDGDVYEEETRVGTPTLSQFMPSVSSRDGTPRLSQFTPFENSVDGTPCLSPFMP